MTEDIDFGPMATAIMDAQLEATKRDPVKQAAHMEALAEMRERGEISSNLSDEQAATTFIILGPAKFSPAKPVRQTIIKL